MGVVLALAGSLGCGDAPYREVEVDLTTAEREPPPDRAAGAPATLRFSVAAMQSPRDTYGAYSRLFSRVSRLLDVGVELVQRRTYREVNDLLLEGRLDVALLCTGGYLELRERSPGAAEVLVVPVVGGRTDYRSLIVVPASSQAGTMEDLRGKRFAFSDELSLSGRTYVVELLRGRNETAAGFFGSTFYTHSHDRSIKAVASGLADGAAVDSLVFDHLVERDPELLRKVRVIDRSPRMKIAPVVVSARLPEDTRARLRAAFLALDRDPEAASALRELRIDRFVVPEPSRYETGSPFVGADD